jgi:hypothetical protein
VNRSFATLKRPRVSLGVATAEDLAAMERARAEQAVIREADLDQLRAIAEERRIAFHPATPAEKIRRRLLED